MEEYELEEIKREIVESRSLSIKTNNLINALSADLKSISKRQQGYERRILFNNATAYVVTIGLLLVLVKFAWDWKVEAIRAENQDTEEEVEELKEDLAAALAREEASARAARQAADFYALIAQKKRREVIEQYPEVSQLPLTRTEQAVFQDAVERAKNDLSIIAYQEGLDHIRTGRWHEARQALQESLDLKRDAAHSPQAAYQVARAMRALGEQRKAIPILMQLSEASVDKEVMDEAALLLADSQLDIEAYNDAKNTLRSFIRRFPSSPHINDARMKLARVQLHH